jgi:hypothetical protein
MTYRPLAKQENCTTEIPQPAECASKIAIMVVTLVKECTEKPNRELEEEILARLRDARIPWMKTVDKITVLGS